jgi:N-acetyl-alpha-D-muramate 1-phosphate uridylyltransferase
VTLPVAILAGGLATRLGEIARQVPKALVDVAGRPFAEHQIDLLVRHGVTRLVFLVGHFGDRIQSAIGDGRRWHIDIQYAYDGPAQLGTGGALGAALDRLGPRFLVLNGDTYLECDYEAIEAAFVGAGTDGLMTISREPRLDRANVRYENGRVVAYEKGAADPRMQHADNGLTGFTREAFRDCPAGAFDLGFVQRALIARQQLLAIEIPQTYFDMGSPEGLAALAAHLAPKVGRESPW